MRKRFVVIPIVLAMLLMVVFPATAITFGEPDGTAHPYVGMLLILATDGLFYGCSGTLLSPTVFLTAGHCTADAVLTWVNFDPEINLEDFPTGWHTGTPVTHPEFNAAFPNTSDIGVVVLGTPLDVGVGVLAEVNTLDDLATRRGRQDTIFGLVGYGMQSVRPFPEWETTRYKATSMLVNLRSALTGGWNLHTSNNPGKGNGTGGACFGDSGGPIFYPADSNVIVAVTSFGLNYNCKGADFAYRVDTEHAQDWVIGFLP